MKTEETNIKALSRAVLREAHDEAQQILAEAEGKSEAIRMRAREQAQAKRTQILERAKLEAKRIHSEAISTAQLKARELQLEQREKLLDDVFEAARQKLAAIQQSSDYGQIARLLLREALTRLEADHAQVRADETTSKTLTEAIRAEISKETGVKVEFGPPLERGMGVIAETKDGHRQYDNTLETRLLRLKDGLRLSVYHLLMGEPL